MPRVQRKIAEHRSARSKPNPLYGVAAADIDYKDSMMLRRFISDRDKIRSRRVTGLTPRQQRTIRYPPLRYGMS
ncbi:30S ribosomal protein S18 [Nakamurella sp. A5-74]|uniref:30S ribosomal protein S18 n=1 Tax=Nakamurella sp. A5-74 TaxID=3158264 RepID=A0AAU8DM48_9ACTN